MNLSTKQKQTHRQREVAKGEGERIHWESGISRYKLLHIEWKNNKVLLYSTGNNIQYSVIKHDGKEYREQDGRGVGGHGVHLSPQIHQEYIFRHRSACRTPADRGQEYLSSGKEYTEPRKTRYDEETSGEDRSVSWTGPALSGWGN